MERFLTVKKFCLARFTINRHNSTSLHFIRARTHHSLISCVYPCVFYIFSFSNLNCSLSHDENKEIEREWNEVPFYVNWREENNRKKNMLLAKIHALWNGWKNKWRGDGPIADEKTTTSVDDDNDNNSNNKKTKRTINK